MEQAKKDDFLDQMQAIIDALPKTRSKVKSTRIPLPTLQSGKLSAQDQWKSLIWNIDTAEAHGKRALNGLTLALTRIIQADILQSLLFDVRVPNQAKDTPSDLLWGEHIPIRADGSKMMDLLRRRRRFPARELEHTAIIPRPWEPWRLSRCLEHLGPGGEWNEWRQTKNLCAIGWTPWPLVWVSNGNHSTMAAMLTHGGRFTVSECLDARELLLNVYSDGKSWLRTDDDGLIAPVNSLPMAGIFEIGRRLVKAPKPSV